MSTNEVVLFGSLIAYGACVGAGWGCCVGRAGGTRGRAAIGAVLTAASTSLLFFFVCTIIGSIVQHGYSLERAVMAGLVAVFILAFTVPWITALPAFVMAVLIQRQAARR